MLSIIIKISADLEYYETLSYPSWTIFRHITFFLSMILLGILFFMTKKKQVYGKKLLYIYIIFIGLIFTLSIFYSARTGKFSNNTISHIYFLLGPYLYVFFLNNLISEKEIDKFVNTTFLLCVCLYLNYRSDRLLVLNNYFQINFWNSYSPFESSAFSGYFYGFMVYYTLKTKKIGWSILSILMVVLTFKRINVLLSILFLIFGLMVSVEKKIPKIIRHSMVLLFTILPMISYYIMRTDKIVDVAYNLGFQDTKGFLMGRDYFFNLLIGLDFESYGLGSADDTLRRLTGHGFELDGLRIFMELGFIGVLAFAITFWTLTKDNLTNIFIMFVFFLNYLSSAQLTDNYVLLFMFLTMSLINRTKYIDFVKMR